MPQLDRLEEIQIQADRTPQPNKMPKMLLFLPILLLLIVAAHIYEHPISRDYQTTVSREDSNIYKEVHYPRRYFITKYCYVYCYYEEAIVDETEMWIYFVDQDERCELKRILR